MSVVSLVRKQVEKPWGRHHLWPGFDDIPADRAAVGEIWFETPPGLGVEDPDLMIKYLFTSEKLSVQVHPGDADARARGQRRGKSEAWQILSAAPHAAIALGTVRPMTRTELRGAAEDGSIQNLIDWRPVKAGDFYYSPAGTVHAIGPGLVLVEIQQNVDLTYRLYDYGRPRELHLDDGVAVAQPVPYVAPFEPSDLAPGRRLQHAGGAFVVERWTASLAGTLAASPVRPVWLVPLGGRGRVGNKAIGAGGVWLAHASVPFALAPGIDMLVAYSGGEVTGALITQDMADPT